MSVDTFDYWLWDEALPKWFCEEQIKSMDWGDSEKGKVFGDKDGIVNEEKRITDVLWLSEDSPIGCIAQIYINMANDKAGWNFNLNACEKIQIGKYSGDTKGFYDWHTDAGLRADEHGLLRKLSVSILLSNPKDFGGGEFELKNRNKQPQLKQGSILVFPSFLEHRVTPVVSGTRYSAVTWVSGPAFR